MRVPITTRALFSGSALAGVVALALSGSIASAGASPRTITMTLLDGSKVTVTVDVPPGTPLDQIKLPPVSSPIVGLSVSGGDTGSAAAPAPSGPATATAPPPIGAVQRQRPSGRRHRRPAGARPPARPHARVRVAKPPPATALRNSNGLPTPFNPTLSLALPAPTPIGVPNFFIDKFRIPPFLLPIYQAAGVEYDVPWQVLAAINEIETDYGRNLSVSSAGAIGWMQFLPQTWKVYGVDATGDGIKDPYNPADAIFAAARYLHAAGASHNLRNAIFAYNHANWYVDSVTLRAKLIGGMPPELVSSLTGLNEGHFPVHAVARYADDVSESQLKDRLQRSHAGAARVASNTARTGVNIYAKAGAPVIAVQDGTVTAIGSSPSLGNYVVLRDAYGNTYRYAQLSTLARLYPVPKPKVESSAQIAGELALPTSHDPKPAQPASAGHQPAVAAPAPGVADATKRVASVVARPTDVAAVDQRRLFAHPTRPAAYVAGGQDQLVNQRLSSGGFASFFTQVYGLHSNDVVLKRLHRGSRVIAGTILGRVGRTSPILASHVLFQVRPAGKGSPWIDPKPILDGWKLLESTSIYRAANKNPFFGRDARAPTVGQILLASKEQLQQRVLGDPNIDIYACGRRDIQAGLIDRRVLGVMEFLSANGLRPSITALRCGHSLFTKGGGITDNAYGDGVDVAKVNGIPVLGHQGPGSITDITIRRLLTLQGIFKPYQIISQMQYPGHADTISLPDHADRVHVGYQPLYAPNTQLGRAIDAALRPHQWIKLIARLNEIGNPTVLTQPSSAAIRDRAAATGPKSGK